MFSSGRVRLGKRTSAPQDTDPLEPVFPPLEPTPDNPGVVVQPPAGDGPGGGGGSVVFPNDPDDPDNPFEEEVPGVDEPVVQPKPGDAPKDDSPGDTDISRILKIVREPIEDQFLAVGEQKFGHSPDGGTWAVYDTVDMAGASRVVATGEWIYVLRGRGAGSSLVRAKDAFLSEAEDVATVNTVDPLTNIIDIERLPHANGVLLFAVATGGRAAVWDGIVWTPTALAGEPVACRLLGKYMGVLLRVPGGFQVALVETLYPTPGEWKLTPVFAEPFDMRTLAGYLRPIEVEEDTAPIAMPFFDGDELNEEDVGGWKFDFATPMVGFEMDPETGEQDTYLYAEVQGPIFNPLHASHGVVIPPEVRETVDDGAHLRATLRLKTDPDRAIQVAVESVNQSLTPLKDVLGAQAPGLSLIDKGEVYVPMDGQLAITSSATYLRPISPDGVVDQTMRLEVSGQDLPAGTVAIEPKTGLVPGTEFRYEQVSGASWTNTAQASAATKTQHYRHQFYKDGVRVCTWCMKWAGGGSAREGGYLMLATADRQHVFTVDHYSLGSGMSRPPIRMFTDDGSSISGTFKMAGGFGRSGDGTVYYIEIINIESGSAWFESANNLGDFQVFNGGRACRRNLTVNNSLDHSTTYLLQLRNCKGITVRFSTANVDDVRVSSQLRPFTQWNANDTYPNEASAPLDGYEVSFSGEGYAYTGQASPTSSTFSLDMTPAGGRFYYEAPQGLAARFPMAWTSATKPFVEKSIELTFANRAFYGSIGAENKVEEIDLFGSPSGSGHPGGDKIGLKFDGGENTISDLYPGNQTRDVRVSHTVVQEGQFVNATSSTPDTWSDSVSDFPAQDTAYARINLRIPEGVKLSSLTMEGAYPKPDDAAGNLVIGGDSMQAWSIAMDPNAEEGTAANQWVSREMSGGVDDAPFVDMATIPQTEGVVAVSLTPAKQSQKTWHYSDDGRTWRHGLAGTGPMLFAREAGGLLFAGSEQPEHGVLFGLAPGEMVAVKAMFPTRSVDHGKILVPGGVALEEQVAQYAGPLENAPEWAQFMPGVFKKGFSSNLMYRIKLVVEDAPFPEEEEPEDPPPPDTPPEDTPPEDTPPPEETPPEEEEPPVEDDPEEEPAP